jgi:Phage integrase family.
MNEATERGLNNNLMFRSKSFSKPHEDTTKIFLTMDEIEKLAKVNLGEDKLKNIVRDYFIISCLTSLRYSDFINIRPEHIKDNKIYMVTRKTSEPVIIPISTLVKSILEKYNYNLPKAPCNQVFNRVLKEVGKIAELDKQVTVTKTKGGDKQTTIYKKYQLLTAHTGRRTMITNCILQRIPTPSIMLMSAHKSLKVFQSYVSLSQVDNAEAMSQHSFFK